MGVEVDGGVSPSNSIPGTAWYGGRNIIIITVEPLNKGHTGTSHFVHYREGRIV